MKHLILVIALSLFFIPVAQAQEFTKEQQAQINKMIETYLLENGEVVLKSVETFQAKKDVETEKINNAKAKEFFDTIADDDKLPMTGNKDGDITLVEFFDYNCGYCHRALEEVIAVVGKDKKLKVVFFDMPILGPSSLEVAKWSLAAHNQGKYFEFHKAAMSYGGQKDDAAMEKISKNLGLDIEKMKEDKNSKVIADTLQKNIEQAQSLNIRGTPGFVIGGKIYPGYMPAENILEIIATARKG